MLPAQIPFRRISNFRKDQRRLDRVENLRRIKLLKRRNAAGTHYIGEKFFAAALGDQALAKLRSARSHRGNFDFGIFFFKVRQQLFVAADVDCKLCLPSSLLAESFPIPIARAAFTSAASPGAVKIPPENNCDYQEKHSRARSETVEPGGYRRDTLQRVHTKYEISRFGNVEHLNF